MRIISDILRFHAISPEFANIIGRFRNKFYLMIVNVQTVVIGSLDAVFWLHLNNIRPIAYLYNENVSKFDYGLIIYGLNICFQE